MASRKSLTTYLISIVILFVTIVLGRNANAQIATPDITMSPTSIGCNSTATITASDLNPNTSYEIELACWDTTSGCADITIANISGVSSFNRNIRFDIEGTCGSGDYSVVGGDYRPSIHWVVAGRGQSELGPVVTMNPEVTSSTCNLTPNDDPFLPGIEAFATISNYIDAQYTITVHEGARTVSQHTEYVSADDTLISLGDPGIGDYTAVAYAETSTQESRCTATFTVDNLYDVCNYDSACDDEGVYCCGGSYGCDDGEACRWSNTLGHGICSGDPYCEGLLESGSCEENQCGGPCPTGSICVHGDDGSMSCLQSDVCGPEDPGWGTDSVNYDGPIVSLEQLLRTLYQLMVPIALGVFAFPLIMINGYKILTSQGDPRKVEEGKEGLTAAIAGTIVVLLAISILRVIINSFFDITF